MNINKTLIERTIYIILMANILITLIISSFIVSFRGSENNLVFFFENDPEFVLALLLIFVIIYPLLFLVVYLIVFIIQLLTKKLYN